MVQLRRGPLTSVPIHPMAHFLAAIQHEFKNMFCIKLRYANNNPTSMKNFPSDFPTAHPSGGQTLAMWLRMVAILLLLLMSLSLTTTFQALRPV